MTVCNTDIKPFWLNIRKNIDRGGGGGGGGGDSCW